MQSNGSPDGSSQQDPKPAETPPDAGAPHPQPELPRWATRATNASPMLEARLAAFIGPKWESTYRAKLAPFLVDPSFTPTWNWAAALGSPFWFLYRKLYLGFIIFYVVPSIVLRYMTGATEPLTLQTAGTPEGRQLATMTMAIFASTVFAAGGTANWLLFRRARAATLAATIQQLPEDAALSWLQRVGGVNRLPTLLLVAISLVFGVAAVLAPRASP